MIECPISITTQVVWHGSDGNDYEIFLYNGAQTIQLTNNDHNDLLPHIHNSWIVWRGYDSHDYEIFLYNGAQTLQLTNNDYNDSFSLIHNSRNIHNGQTVWGGYISPQWEIFLYDGTKVIQLTNNTYDDLLSQIYNNQVVWWAYDGTDYEIFLATPSVIPSLALLDGSDFSVGREVSNNPQDLASGGSSVTGAVTDGVTRLLLRLTTDKPQTITFSLQGTGNPQEDGTLRSIDGFQQGNPITVNTVEVNTKQYAFAIYQSPENFARQNYPEDKTTSERKISLKIDYGSSVPLQQEIKLVRPPLILVHGLWSGPRMWSNFANSLKSKLPIIRIFLVDYKNTNASHFEVNRYELYIDKDNGIFDVKQRLRSEGIAMVQADVLGHSMGGLLARIWTGFGDYVYFRNNNFWAGDINKLITIDSPHYGSFLADAGIACVRGPHSLKAHNFFLFMEATGHSLTKGAVEDLMTTSKPIEKMNGIEITLPSHTIAGDYKVTIKPIVPYTEPKDSKDLIVGGLPSDYFDIHNYLIQEGYGDGIISNLRSGSDLVVSIYSQNGGLALPASETLSHHHMGATTQDVVNKTIELLNSYTDSNLFNSGFPKDE